MKEVRIRVYQTNPSDSANQKVLMQTHFVKVESDKPLNASRAAKIIKRTLPAYGNRSGPLIIKTEEGWQVGRSLEVSEKCSFHYTWEYAVISEWEF